MFLPRGTDHQPRWFRSAGPGAHAADVEAGLGAGRSHGSPGENGGKTLGKSGGDMGKGVEKSSVLSGTAFFEVLFSKWLVKYIGRFRWSFFWGVGICLPYQHHLQFYTTLGPRPLKFMINVYQCAVSRFEKDILEWIVGQTPQSFEKKSNLRYASDSGTMVMDKKNKELLRITFRSIQLWMVQLW